MKVPDSASPKSKVKGKGSGVPPQPKSAKGAKGGDPKGNPKVPGVDLGNGKKGPTVNGYVQPTPKDGKGAKAGDPKAEKQDPKGKGKKLVEMEVLYDREWLTAIAKPSPAHPTMKTKAPPPNLRRIYSGTLEVDRS